MSISRGGLYPRGTKLIDNNSGDKYVIKITINRSSSYGRFYIDVTSIGDTFFSKTALLVGYNKVLMDIYSEKGSNPNRKCYFKLEGINVTIVYKIGDYGAFMRLHAVSLYNTSDTISAEYMNKMPNIDSFTEVY